MSKSRPPAERQRAEAAVAGAMEDRSAPGPWPELAASLLACTSREAWCDLLLAAAMALVPAARALVSFEGSGGTRPRLASEAAGSADELSAPVTTRGRVIGTLVMNGSPRAGGFTAADADRLRALAEVAGRAWPAALPATP